MLRGEDKIEGSSVTLGCGGGKDPLPLFACDDGGRGPLGGKFGGGR